MVPLWPGSGFSFALQQWGARESFEPALKNGLDMLSTSLLESTGLLDWHCELVGIMRYKRCDLGVIHAAYSGEKKGTPNCLPINMVGLPVAWHGTYIDVVEFLGGCPVATEIANGKT